MKKKTKNSTKTKTKTKARVGAKKTVLARQRKTRSTEVTSPYRVNRNRLYDFLFCMMLTHFREGAERSEILRYVAKRLKVSQDNVGFALDVLSNPKSSSNGGKSYRPDWAKKKGLFAIRAGTAKQRRMYKLAIANRKHHEDSMVAKEVARKAKEAARKAKEAAKKAVRSAAKTRGSVRKLSEVMSKKTAVKRVRAKA